ncbi:hypothetical protein [Haloarchaeobius sp. DFWS5]|uniref:hypothetical protein n=1 Tax=Haloarchaeobius sp. DFWS5 TaxID=3446114 RepID=UPI003EB6FAB2
MLGSPKIRKLVAGATAAYGLVSLVLPRQTTKLTQRLVLGRSYENVKELEPKDWYVESTRASGLGMLVGGLFGFILADRAEDKAAAAAAKEAEEGDFDEADDDEIEPVEVDLDDAADFEDDADDDSVDVDVV